MNAYKELEAKIVDIVAKEIVNGDAYFVITCSDGTQFEIYSPNNGVLIRKID